MSGFTNSEYVLRIEKIVDYINEQKADGFFITNPYNIFYFGLYYYPGKRPIVLFIHKSGEVFAFTPRMEYHAALKVSHFNQVYAYDDNFTKSYDMYDFITEHVAKKCDVKDFVFIDETDITGQKKLNAKYKRLEISQYVMECRQIKSSEEIKMLKISGYYSDFMVESGKQLLKPSISEIGLLNRMITKTVDKMVDDLGEIIYVPGAPAGALVPSGVRTSMPHALPSARKIEEGDSVILSCGTNVWGYRTESERTFFLGRPSQEVVELFEVMREAQQLGIDLMIVGNVCEDIENTVIEFIKKHKFDQYIKHRTGHGKGLEEHESPYIASGDKTVLKEGMIFSSEPGLYIDGVAGVRHSDIVHITNDGPELITNYPKDLVSMIID